MLDQITSNKILKYCKLNGYPLEWFNIIYVEGMDVDGRLNADLPNQFNDIRCIFNKEKCVDVWTATVEPGAYYTERPMNPNGAFRIAFGYYKNAWEIGLHGSNPHEALVQIREVEGFRDYNRDGFRTGDRRVKGLFGINQHWGYDLPVNDISTASAGCLVGRSTTGHKQFMAYCRNSGLSEFSTIVIPGNELK